MTPAFVPEPFAEPLVSPQTSTLFRRTPYISPSEFKAAPTAVATGGLVPGGTPEAQLAALAAVIMRASDMVDTLVYHKADGTFAASPSTEQGWITPRGNGALALICNYRPILQVNALALGPSLQNMQSIGNEAAQALTIEDPIIWLQGGGVSAFGQQGFFPAAPTVGGKIYAVWSYVNGFPHSFLAEDASEGASALVVGPSVPGGSVMYGVYPGTQLTVHDGANTEVVVVESVAGLTLNLLAPTLYAHEVPANPDSIRVSSVPWVVEQATISLTSYLVKTRGSRAMVMPQVAGGQAKGQAESQSGGTADYNAAVKMLKPFVVPVMRST